MCTKKRPIEQAAWLEALLGEEAYDFCVYIFFIDIKAVCFFVVDFGSALIGVTIIGTLPF